MDIGTARCDFPGGDANDLFRSGRKLLSLSDHVKIWTGHDYPPQGRGDPVPWMSVQDHKKLNKHFKDGISEEEFVALRKERDAGLAEPKLLHQSLQSRATPFAYEIRSAVASPSTEARRGRSMVTEIYD